MSKYKPNKECYDSYKKECSDANGYCPKHIHATIFCMLDEILEKLSKCACGNSITQRDSISSDQKTESSAGINQNGTTNINTGAVSSSANNSTSNTIEEKVTEAKKKGK